MAIEINGQMYYKTSEACRKTGISRTTLFRWLNVGIISNYCKDRRGWMLFIEEDLNKIRAETGKIEIADSFHRGENG